MVGRDGGENCAGAGTLGGVGSWPGFDELFVGVEEPPVPAEGVEPPGWLLPADDVGRDVGVGET